VVIPIPGPDRICLYDPLMLEMKEVPGAGVSAITVSPNPASGYITIHAAEVISSIEVFDSQGGLVYNKLVNDSEIRISVREFPSGIYVVRAKAQGRYLQGKFLVSH
jgi:hypothetical protein